MKKLLITCFPVLLLFVSVSGYSQSQESLAAKFTDLVTQTKVQYALDARTVVCELDLESAGDTTSFVIRTSEAAIYEALQEQLQTCTQPPHLELLPDQSVQEKPYGVVTLSVANLRTKPRHAAEMATQLLLGTGVVLLQEKEGHYRVRTPEGYIAWVPKSSLTPMDHVEWTAWNQKEHVIYTADFGQTEVSDHAGADRVSDVVFGNIFAKTGETDTHYHIAYPDGRTAYVAKKEAQSLGRWLSEAQSTSGKQIIASAYRMLGLPYLWGGTSVKGADCSGFVKTAFFMNGWVIPRDASQQVLSGNFVDVHDAQGHPDATKIRDNLQPADLLFFSDSVVPGQTSRITHVALYVGDGLYIHASGSVKCNALHPDSALYDAGLSKRLVAARRYLHNASTELQSVALHPMYPHE